MMATLGIEESGGEILIHSNIRMRSTPRVSSFNYLKISFTYICGLSSNLEPIYYHLKSCWPCVNWSLITCFRIGYHSNHLICVIVNGCSSTFQRICANNTQGSVLVARFIVLHISVLLSLYTRSNVYLSIPPYAPLQYSIPKISSEL